MSRSKKDGGGIFERMMRPCVKGCATSQLKPSRTPPLTVDAMDEMNKQVNATALQTDAIELAFAKRVAQIHTSAENKDELELEYLLSEEEKIINNANKLHEKLNRSSSNPTALNNIVTAVTYLLKSVEDRNKYINYLILKNKKNILIVLMTNYSNRLIKREIHPKESAIKYGKYDEHSWMINLMLLKLKLIQLRKNDILSASELSEIIKYIRERDILSNTEIQKKIASLFTQTSGGSTQDDVKHFRKLLKKHTPTAIPKTHLLKKSDLKKHSKIYVVKSPAYDKVTLLKNTAEFSSSDKWIRVNAKSLKWFIKKCSDK